jgi:hypothetical protein
MKRILGMGSLMALALVSCPGPAPITDVTGTILDDCGFAASNVTVVIPGKGSATPNAQGKFTIANVTGKYDIAVLDTGTKKVTLYKGITTKTPTLRGGSSGLPNSTLTTYKNKVTGGAGFPMPSVVGEDNEAKAAFVGIPLATKSTSVNTTSGIFDSGSIGWCGTGTTLGTWHVLQYRKNTTTGLPSDYTGYGKRGNITLVNSSSVDESGDSNKNITLSNVTEGNVSGTVTIPGNYDMGSKSAATLIENALFSIASESNTSTGFSYVTPNIAGAKNLIAIAAKSNSSIVPQVQTTVIKANLDATASGVGIVVPSGAALSLPASNGTNVDTTTLFSWSQLSATGGVLYTVSMSSGVGEPSFIIYTNELNTTIPDLTAQGLGLPLNKDYAWRVNAVNNVADMDQTVSVAGIPNLFGGSSDPALLNKDFVVSATDTRPFKTKP